MSGEFMDRDFRWLLYAAAHAYQGGHQSGGGVRRLAEDMGVSPSLLSRWIDPDEGEDLRFMPAERLVQFCRLTGTAGPAGHLAHKLGLLLFQIPTARERSGDELVHFTGQVGRTAEQLHRYFHGNGGDRKETLKALDDLIRQAAGYRLAVRKHNPRQLHLKEDRP